MKIKHDCATNACPANGHNVDILKYEEMIEDMLEALDLAIPVLERFAAELGVNPEACTVVQKVHAAIKKVKGE